MLRELMLIPNHEPRRTPMRPQSHNPENPKSPQTEFLQWKFAHGNGRGPGPTCCHSLPCQLFVMALLAGHRVPTVDGLGLISRLWYFPLTSHIAASWAQCLPLALPWYLFQLPSRSGAPFCHPSSPAQGPDLSEDARLSPWWHGGSCGSFSSSVRSRGSRLTGQERRVCSGLAHPRGGADASPGHGCPGCQPWSQEGWAPAPPPVNCEFRPCLCEKDPTERKVGDSVWSHGLCEPPRGATEPRRGPEATETATRIPKAWGRAPRLRVQRALSARLAPRALPWFPVPQTVSGCHFLPCRRLYWAQQERQGNLCRGSGSLELAPGAGRAKSGRSPPPPPPCFGGSGFPHP